MLEVYPRLHSSIDMSVRSGSEWVSFCITMDSSDFRETCSPAIFATGRRALFGVRFV